MMNPIEKVRVINRAGAFGPPVYLICLGLALVSLPAALGLAIILVIYCALPVGINAR